MNDWELWSLLAELERAAWARNWAQLKKARKKIAEATGQKRPPGMRSSFDIVPRDKP